MHSIDRARHGIRSELTSLPAPGERHGRSFTARIEGAHSDRAASASTGVADHILSGFFSAPSDWQVLGRSFDNIAGNLPHLLQGKGYDDIAPPWHSPIVARVTPQRFLPRDRVVGSQLRAWNEHRPTTYSLLLLGGWEGRAFQWRRGTAIPILGTLTRATAFRHLGEASQEHAASIWLLNGQTRFDASRCH